MIIIKTLTQSRLTVCTCREIQFSNSLAFDILSPEEDSLGLLSYQLCPGGQLEGRMVGNRDCIGQWLGSLRGGRLLMLLACL